jgi:hypothetical protein
MPTVILLTLATIILAQENPVTVERPIMKLRNVGQDAEVDAARCGEYLLFWAKPVGIRPDGPRIAYNVEKVSGDPDGATLAYSFLKERFVFIEDNTKKTPTSKLDLVDGKVTKVTIKMSGRDLKVAQACWSK